MELVEGAAGGIHLRVVLPRLRDHHQHRVGERAPAEVQQLEHLVERRGIARVGRDDRREPRQVTRDEVGLQQRFARGHPVAVAAQRVDLTVVRDVAVGVRERPRRERVGGETGVHERERGDHALVGEVRVERLDLRLGQHALVDDRARRERGEVDVGGVLGALAQAERAPLQVQAGLARHTRDEQLAERGHDASRGGAQVRAVGVGGQLAPPQHPQALLGRKRVDLGHHRVAPLRGQERQARGVGALRGQLEPDDGTEERVGDLEEDARAVAGVDLGSAGAAVLQPQQRRERPPDDGVVAATLEVGHHRDATGVVLELRDVEVLVGGGLPDVGTVFSQGGPPVVSVHPDNQHRDDVMERSMRNGPSGW